MMVVNYHINAPGSVNQY